MFFPNITVALEIVLSLPAISCIAKRSFSTLRSVKIWLWSTTDENLLISPCM